MPIIKLKSSDVDGQVFPVALDIATKSNMIKQLIAESRLRGLQFELNEDFVLHFTGIKANILKMLIDWAKHHKNDTTPHTEFFIGISDWAQNFLEVDIDTLLKLFDATSFMDMKDLLYACLHIFSKLIKGKTEQQIRRILGSHGQKIIAMQAKIIADMKSKSTSNKNQR